MHLDGSQQPLPVRENKKLLRGHSQPQLLSGPYHDLRKALSDHELEQEQQTLVKGEHHPRQQGIMKKKIVLRG